MVFDGLISLWNNFNLLGTGTDLIVFTIVLIGILGTKMSVQDKMSAGTGILSLLAISGLITSNTGGTILIILTIMTVVINIEE